MRKKKKLIFSLAATESLIKDFSSVLSIPPEVLKTLAEIVNTDRGIVVENTESLVELWKNNNLPLENFSGIISVLKYFFDKAIEYEFSVDELIEELQLFCKERALNGFDERIEALRLFFTPKPKYLRMKKVLPFSFGVVPNLEAVSGVVQLRAAFKERSSNEIDCYIPIVQISLRSKDTNTDESTRFVFQTGEDGLSKLIEELINFQNQLISMKESLHEKIEIFSDTDSFEEGIYDDTIKID